jgi:hypothetical protein
MSSQITHSPTPLTPTGPAAVASALTKPFLKKPLILDYYHFTEEHEPYLKNTLNKLLLTCKICNREIAASIKITSNWITHLKVAHMNEYQEYSKKKAPKVKYNKLLGMMHQNQQQPISSNYIPNVNYDPQRYPNGLNGVNSQQDPLSYYETNEDDNEEDILEYEENDNEYFKSEQNNWNSTSSNHNKSTENNSLEENENWFAVEQNSEYYRNNIYSLE